jgi:hypothetical protein
MPLYISGVNAAKYPKEPVRTFPGVTLTIIPIDDLEMLERSA